MPTCKWIDSNAADERRSACALSSIRGYDWPWRPRVASWLATGVLAAVMLATGAGCSSTEESDAAPSFDQTYFDRLEAEQAAKRAAVMSAGLWADEDGSGHRFGVILPLQGGYRRAGDSVLAGVMAGYWADDPKYRGRVTFYKEEQYGSLRDAYAKALRDGAEVLIGPLSKESVQKMVENTVIAKPTIALNTTRSEGWQERDLYQFSLSIEDEAINAARALYNSGHRRVFVLYEDNEVGSRAMRAFSSEILRLDGRVADTVQFSARAFAYDIPARRIADATSRVKVLSVNPTEQRYQVYRNGDAVFMAGERGGLAGMTWALKAAGVTDIPIVTTSHAHAGDAGLEGVYAVDLPWIADARMRTEVWGRTPVDFQEEERRLDERLFAMGMDSYRLAQNIDWMAQNRDRTLAGVTGVMKVGPGGRIQREMVLGKVEGSQVRVATLPKVDPNTARPIGEIVVKDGIETAVAVSAAPSSSWFAFRNPFRKTP
ncbi:MAG: penicillin-binding protein activator [Gammaproteobacteria bacterium]|nr:penicillin-binding protein activator [Gammaproteobacteria bacterium]